LQREERKDGLADLKKELNMDLFKTPPRVKDSDDDNEGKPARLRDE
jgi:hypothetical protein